MSRVTQRPVVILALTASATATALGIKPAAVFAAIEDGTLPVYQIGAKRRILTSDIEAWVRSWTRKYTKRRKVLSHDD